tara:strand:- start:548 stop:1915 length:1368 start_codon:yes stop_codon:yes gene_type:complete
MFTSSKNRRQLSIRKPAVAGSFYPQNANQLNHMLEDYLTNSDIHIKPPKAIIAPHAGYIYSGQIAANIYRNIEKLKSQITRVVLLGPAHRVYVKGIALPSNTHFATPLGNVPLDTNVLSQLEHHSDINFSDAAHEQEHSLEVHLPFLQKVLNDFTLIPLLVGDAGPEQVATILKELWGGNETLIVISSDLSHFLDYETACKTDNNTTRLIENFDYESISSNQACGCMPMCGLLKYAHEKNMSIQTLDLRNSGDTAGTKDRVVGYGAYALFNGLILNENDKTTVFDVINKSIQLGLDSGDAYIPETQNYPAQLQEKYAVFITLKLNGQLRGCIGTTEARMPLINAVAHFAHAAAFCDPRFKPLVADEFEQVEISLSLLTPATAFPFKDEQDLIEQLRQNVDGLIIAKNNARATFLPAVWESISNKRQFLDELKRKAGIQTSDSPDKAWRYTAEYYS